jgi:hypothetical protein
MRPGCNPTRRNRNVGTKAHGHGNDNRLTIPEPWNDLRLFYERIGPHRIVSKPIGPHTVKFVVEEPRPGWFHPCMPAEIGRLLRGCPQEHVELVPMIVLRQPTRKQRILSQVWGRAVFQFEFGDYSGRAIIIEAQDSLPYTWKRSRTPEHEREIERLRQDGHSVLLRGRSVIVEPNPESVRNTVLYRTLLHEVGHHVDHAQSTSEQWDGRTSSEREDFAHLYAAAAYERLRSKGIAPVDRSLFRDALADELPLDWFMPREDV